MAVRRMGNQDVYYDEQATPPAEDGNATTGQGNAERGPILDGGPTPNDAVEPPPDTPKADAAPAPEPPANVAAMQNALAGSATPEAPAASQWSVYGEEYDRAHANDAANFFNSDAGRAVAPTGANTGTPTAGPAAGAPAAPTGPATTTNGSLAAQRLAEILGRPLTPDANDPNILKPTQAFNLAAQRAEERQRAQAAEAASVNGQSSSGGMANTIADIRQKRGEAEASYQGQLYQQETARREQVLQNAIAQAQQAGDNEAARALSLQLAQMQDATSRYGIQTGADTARAGLNENARQFDLTLAEQRQQAELSRQMQAAGMSASNANAEAARQMQQMKFEEEKRQFDISTGQNQSQFEAQLNQQALLALLGQTG